MDTTRILAWVYRVHHAIIHKLAGTRWLYWYRFGLSGVLSQVVYYTTYITIIYVLDGSYLVAATVGFLGYLTINFISVRSHVFRSQGSLRTQLPAYAALHSANQGVTLIGLSIMIGVAGWNELVAQMIMTAVYFLINLTVSPRIFGQPPK